MFKIAIYSNEILCDELKRIIIEIKEDLLCNNIGIYEFYNRECLIEKIREGNLYDLIFLDIEFSIINSIEIAKFIRIQMEDYITKIIYSIYL